MSDDMKPDDKPIDDRFYIVTYERGRETDSLPTWANAGSNAIAFEDRASTDICRVDIDGVPGAFQILNVLTTSECDQFVQLTESMGYHADSPVSLPHSIRHNHNVNWVVDESVDGTIWTRCEALMGPGASGAQALGINARFRFYRYEKGDHFKLHTDGAWPGSRIVERRLLQDAYGDRQSEMTFLLFLSDGYQGRPDAVLSEKWHR